MATLSSTIPSGSASPLPQPVLPYSSTKAGSGPARARLGPVLRRAGDDLELLQQLRPAPARGSSSRARSPTSSTGAAQSSTVPGLNVRDWIHVDDHNTGVWAIIDRGQDQRDLPSALTARSTMSPSSATSSGHGQDPNAFDHVTDRAGHDLRYAIDSTRLRTELGWEPQYRDFRSGLQATIDWYQASEDWWRPMKSRDRGPEYATATKRSSRRPSRVTRTPTESRTDALVRRRRQRHARPGPLRGPQTAGHAT